MKTLFDNAIIGGEKNALAFISNLLQASTEYAIIGFDLEGKILLWNDGASKLYGYSAEEILKIKDFSLLPMDKKDKDNLFEIIKKTALKEGKWKGSIESVKKNQTKFNANIVATLHINKETPVGLLMIICDITDQSNFKKMQKLNIERLEQEVFYNRTLIDSITSALLITDIKGKIIDLNKAAEELTGYTRDELITSPFQTYFVDKEVATNNFDKVMANGEICNIEQIMRPKNGNDITINFCAVKIYNNLGSELGVFTASNDISEKKELENKLKDESLILEKANIAKDRFLASLSHELRTPLNSIIGFTDILLLKLSGPLTDVQEDQLKTISLSSQLLLSLTNDLLDVAKIESGRKTVHLEEVDCLQIVKEVVASVTPFVKQKNLALNIKLPNKDIFIESDRRMLKQIMINLVNNAIKFTEHGEITIILDEEKVDEKPCIGIHVIDTGIGIKLENQEHLFNAFQQGGDFLQAPEDNAGAGLGLFLCKEFAELINGKIIFESDFEKGSRFSLILPLTKAANTRDSRLNPILG